MAAERLDKTVEHLGMQFREDLPQGEIDEQQVVVQNPHEQLPLNLFRLRSLLRVRHPALKMTGG